MENAIAKCQLPGKEESKHITYFTPHWLHIINGKKKWRFENEHVTHIEFNHHRLLMPLIMGGLLGSFAILVITRNLFDPFWALIFFLSGLFLGYYGWLGSDVVVIHEGQHTTKVYLKAISKNLKEYFRYYRNYCVNQVKEHIIYHIALAEDWNSSKSEYSHESLSSEGFIHASRKEQVAETFKLYFPKEGNFILLEIDSFKLKHELKYEAAPSRNQTFPHIFGPINRDSVKSARSFGSIEELNELLKS